MVQTHYFARNDALQIVTWLIAAAMAVGVAWLREYLATQRASFRRAQSNKLLLNAGG